MHYCVLKYITMYFDAFYQKEILSDKKKARLPARQGQFILVILPARLWRERSEESYSKDASFHSA